MSTSAVRKLALRGVAGLLVLVPATVIVILIADPISASLEQAANNANLARRYQKLVAERPLYRAALARARATLTGQGMLYAGSSAELAGARLQNTVQALVTENGGQILSSAIDPARSDHHLQVLTVSLACRFAARRLPRFLAALAVQKPFLVVRALDLRSTDMGTHTGPLDVQLQVEGFRDAS
ncbi:type II secretion system protein GspM [Acidiphilium iwatense]|uniref:Type II secretion system protein GspM n=1 Tax=Acidiphilium iwatense TaxID=768198 RepID=A0ABS9DVR8_9PROT|nr:type II secretion system protein GspM [Acidiphilium iwatense]MCF3945776.1 type II secretion system protein GspM [Acidiphilium iwatense]